jgi:hypothetical protein
MKLQPEEVSDVVRERFSFLRTKLTSEALYYSASTFSGAFSGLIAYAIGFGNNTTRAATGKDPWRWLFIIEGVMGICIGIFAVMMLP